MCYRMSMEYAHDEYRDTLLTNGACNSQAGTRAHYAILVDVTQSLMCFNDLSLTQR
jgi:hypothetical protein